MCLAHWAELMISGWNNFMHECVATHAQVCQPYAIYSLRSLSAGLKKGHKSSRARPSKYPLPMLLLKEWSTGGNSSTSFLGNIIPRWPIAK